MVKSLRIAIFWVQLVYAPRPKRKTIFLQKYQKQIISFQKLFFVKISYVLAELMFFYFVRCFLAKRGHFQKCCKIIAKCPAKCKQNFSKMFTIRTMLWIFIAVKNNYLNRSAVIRLSTSQNEPKRADKRTNANHNQQQRFATVFFLLCPQPGRPYYLALFTRAFRR